MKIPSPEERSKERSIAFALANDIFCDAGLVILAVVTGSLTLLGEAARAVLMLLLLSYSYWILRSVHRGQLSRYEFGVVKLEHFATLLLGIGLLFSAFWLVQTIVETVFSERDASTPMGLAFAAVINAVNAFFNTVNYVAIRASRKGHQSEAFRAQLQARFIMMASSMILQVTLTAAAVAQDPLLALFFDVLGATFVCVLMVRNGIIQIVKSLPILLDWNASPEQRGQISAVTEKRFPAEEISSLRTRRLTGSVIAELVLTMKADVSLADLNTERMLIERELRENGLSVDLEIAPEHSGSDAFGERENMKSPGLPGATEGSQT